jgi:hypothetical protein
MSEKTPAELHAAVQQSRKFAEAEQARQAFAKAHGYANFADVLTRGIQAVGQGYSKAPPAPESREWQRDKLDVTALVDQARKRMGTVA